MTPNSSWLWRPIVFDRGAYAGLQRSAIVARSLGDNPVYRGPFRQAKCGPAGREIARRKVPSHSPHLAACQLSRRYRRVVSWPL